MLVCRVVGEARTGALRAGFLVTVLLATTGCDSRDTRLRVASELPEDLLDYVEEAFESANPTVDVRFVGLDERSGWPDADLWWGADAIRYQAAAAAGVLEAYAPAWSDSGRAWTATRETPFVIAFNREQLQLTRAPTDWIDVFHHRFTGEIAVLDPNRTTEGAYFVGAMIVEALRDDDDLNRGFDWLTRLTPQIERYVDDSQEAIRALETGEATLAILPRGDVELARNGPAPWLHYRVPESGTPVLVSGVAVMTGTPIPEVARRFVDMLGTPEVAREVRLHTHWRPTQVDVDPASLPGDFELALRVTPYELAIDTLTSELGGWLDRWELEVRDR